MQRINGHIKANNSNVRKGNSYFPLNTITASSCLLSQQYAVEQEALEGMLGPFGGRNYCSVQPQAILIPSTVMGCSNE